MLRLTWRNLLARKVRLLMSTLAIVLGIGFLAGVMTFSTGLNATFENIVSGSTSDAMVPHRGRGLREATPGSPPPSGSPLPTSTSCRALPEVAGRDGVGRRLRLLPARQGRQAGRRPGRAHPRVQLRRPARTWPASRSWCSARAAGPSKPGEVTLDTSSAERGGYEIGDTVTMIVPTASQTPAVRSPSSAPRTSTAAARPAPPSCCSTPGRRRTSSSAGRTPSRASRSRPPTGSPRGSSPPLRSGGTGGLHRRDRRQGRGGGPGPDRPVPRRHLDLPQRLRGDRDRRRRVHHLQHLLDPGVASASASPPCCGRSGRARSRSPGRCWSRPS